jgi:uncharacterized membrane protein
MSENPVNSLYTQPRPIDRLITALLDRWLVIFGILFGALVILPFLAPVLMRFGLTGPAQLVYLFYSILCHQLPERSFFLFGPQTMYSLDELQRAGADTSNMFTLRQFIGSPDLGWKVAWSDRMVWMYSGVLIFGLLWRPFLSNIKGLPWWGFGLFLVPMAVDGTSHFISDLSGIGQGFRADNAWLAELTGYAFSQAFYVGDALGSFNSWMRMLSGILFGLGVVWFAFPHLEKIVSDPPARQIKYIYPDDEYRNMRGLLPYDND